ncbi:MAG: tRNA-dihydrouridine synthase family protein [Kiritimatiellia bacterium]
MNLTVSDKQSDIFCLAPLRGVTVRVFRNALAECFDVPDVAVTPFVASVAGEKVRSGLLADIDPAREQRLKLIPQVIGKDAGQLRVMLRAFKDMGYKRADLNAGCPWPFVMKKGRGCGLMMDADNFAHMIEVGCEEMPCGFSVKVRLGIKSPDLLLERMELLNQFPLREVTVHARTAEQMYDGNVLLDDFARIAGLCRHTLVYNGDICSFQDFEYLKHRFPFIFRWMIGRGLSVDPFLMESIHRGKQVARNPERLRRFLDLLLDASVYELAGDKQVLGRVKELWSYLHVGLKDGKRIWNSVKICRSVDEYRRVTDGAFRREPEFKQCLSRIKISE